MRPYASICHNTTIMSWSKPILHDTFTNLYTYSPHFLSLLFKTNNGTIMVKKFICDQPQKGRKSWNQILSHYKLIQMIPNRVIWTYGILYTLNREKKKLFKKPRLVFQSEVYLQPLDSSKKKSGLFLKQPKLKHHFGSLKNHFFHMKLHHI